jgi:hypothetical protein
MSNPDEIVREVSTSQHCIELNNICLERYNESNMPQQGQNPSGLTSETLDNRPSPDMMMV